MAIVLRQDKGSPLTQAELDNNQKELGARLGNWSSTISYSSGQLVAFLGNIYRSLADSNVNNLPNSTPQWETYNPPHTHGFSAIATATSTDVTLAANSNTLLPTQRAVKTYVDSAVAGSNYTDEQAQDAAATALIAGNAGGDFTWSYNDASNTITGVVSNGVITGTKIANNTIQLGKIVDQVGPCVIGRGTGTGPVTFLTIGSGLSVVGGTTLALANIGAQTLQGAEIAGSPVSLTLGNNLTISGTQLRTNVASARLLGRASAGTGQVEEIILGTGLSFTGTTLNSTGGSGYTFTNTARLYGRASAGGGTGEEISLGSGLALSGSTLSATGSGYTFANTARIYGRSSAGSGPGEELSVGNLLTIDAGTLRTNVVTSRLLGRATAGTGQAEEISLGTGLSFVGTTLNAATGYTFTNTSRIYGRYSAGGGAGEEIQLGNLLTVDSGTLRTNITSSRLLGRATAGTGEVEQITLGAGLSFDGTTLNAAGTVYNFSDTNRIYGRHSTGAGPGEEIVLGTGLTLDAGTLNAVSPPYEFAATSRLLGRSTAGAGPGEELTVGSVLTINGGELTTSVTEATILGRYDTGTGPAQELILGSGLVLDNLTGELSVNAPAYVFGTDNRIYGRSSLAGPGAGEEIDMGPLMVVDSGVLRLNANAGVLLGRGPSFGYGDVEEITLGTNLSLDGTTLNAASGGAYEFTSDNRLYGISKFATVPGPGGEVRLEPFFRINSGTLNTHLPGPGLAGHTSPYGGSVEYITLGSGLEFSGTTLIATGGGGGSYTFVNSDRLYGRATPGGGPGEEIQLGTGLAFDGTILNCTVGGGTLGVFGYETVWGVAPFNRYRLVLASADTSDPQKSFAQVNNSAIITCSGTPGSFGKDRYVNITRPISYVTTISSTLTGSTSFEDVTYCTAIASNGGSWGTNASFTAAIATASPRFTLGSYNSIVSSNTGWISGSYSNITSSSEGRISGTYSVIVASGGTANQLLIDNSSDRILAGAVQGIRFLNSSYSSAIASGGIIATDFTNSVYSTMLSGFEVTLYNSNYALIHGIHTSGTHCSRTYNYVRTNAFDFTLPMSNDFIAGDAGRDSLAIRETTLMMRNVTGTGTANAVIGSAGNSDYDLKTLLKGSSSTMAPFYYLVKANILAVLATGAKAATWEGTALFKGTGVDTAVLVGQTMTKTFDTTPALAAGTVPVFRSASYGPNPSDTPAIMAEADEGGTVVNFYVDLRIQAMIRANGP